MSEIANARINTFGPSPKADFVPPADPIFEIPASELQGLLNEMVLTHNQMAEMIRDAGIIRGRELARLTESHNASLKAERSPLTKLLLLNAYIRQFLTKIRDALNSRPAEGGKVVQVCTKIMARAVQIVDYIKTITQDDPKRKEISMDSQQARILFQGANGEPVSRKETIRAMKRAEVLWPALQCDHRPNDGRQTTRLIARVEELKDSPIFGYLNLWQRSDRCVSLNI
jgi:citrate synthase